MFNSTFDDADSRNMKCLTWLKTCSMGDESTNVRLRSQIQEVFSVVVVLLLVVVISSRRADNALRLAGAAGGFAVVLDDDFRFETIAEGNSHWPASNPFSGRLESSHHVSPFQKFWITATARSSSLRFAFGGSRGKIECPIFAASTKPIAVSVAEPFIILVSKSSTAESMPLASQMAQLVVLSLSSGIIITGFVGDSCCCCCAP